jgi:hypothetical protein
MPISNSIAARWFNYTACASKHGRDAFVVSLSRLHVIVSVIERERVGATAQFGGAILVHYWHQLWRAWRTARAKSGGENGF